MKNTFKTDSEDIPDGNERALISLLNTCCEKLGLDYFLIGARAKDYWFSKYELSPRRFTRDIDFAVLVPGIEEFNKLVTLLQEEYAFMVLEKMPHRLIWSKNELIVDLIPFGGIEESGYVHFKDSYDTVISVVGLMEVYNQAVEIIKDDKKSKLATLPGICVLKLSSWLDKPEERTRDLIDIQNILEHFFDIESEKIFEQHNDLFGAEDFDITLAGARVLGREMNLIIKESKTVRNRLLSGLKDGIGIYSDPGRLILAITGATGMDQEYAYKLFMGLLDGLED